MTKAKTAVAKERTQILKRLGNLVPDVDAIALAYGVDQKRAEKIQSGLGVVLEFVGDLIVAQAEFIEGQADTAKMIERKIGRERDAKDILGDVSRFLSGEKVKVEYILKRVFSDFFANEFSKLKSEIQVELFIALSKAINSLQENGEESDNND